MCGPKYSQIWPVAVAIILVICVIAAIKFFFLPIFSLDSDSPTQNVWALEIAAFLCILGVILFAEIFDGFLRFYVLLSRSRKERKEYQHHLNPSYIVVVFAVSAIIYSTLWVALTSVNHPNQAVPQKSNPPEQPFHSRTLGI